MYTSAIFALLFAIATQTATPHVEAASLSRDELVAMAMADATAYHLNINHFVSTIACESNFVVDEVGDNGTSFGIVQIHLVAHPDVSKEEALDPIFALDWAARQWSIGNEKIWTCYRQLYKKGQSR